MNGPTSRTLKRLFALSSNRCAFPHCTTPVILEGSVVGQVCHIQAEQKGGPRYDLSQSDEERHGYENLILLCSPHHKVIDDDEESYSVERLLRMKHAHESQAAKMDDREAVRGADILVSLGQSGGVTAHTIHAGVINVHPTQTVLEADRERRMAVITAQALHRRRVDVILGDAPPVAILSGATLIMHIVPMQPKSGNSFRSSTDVSVASKFPPGRLDIVRDWKLTYDGLLLGSNYEGLGRKQGAYSLWFRTGEIESASNFGGSGRMGGGAIELPKLQETITRLTFEYVRSLEAFGGQYPTIAVVSLCNARGMRMLKSFAGDSWWDVPCEEIPNDYCSFGHAVFESTPKSLAETEAVLSPILTHLANTAGLAEPYAIKRK